MGTAFVWDDSGRREFPCADPESEVDGDLFWIWADGAEAMVSFEDWDRQARDAARELVAQRPELGGLAVSERSPFASGMTLGAIAAGDDPSFPDARVVERWYHGTTTARLGTIMEEGISGDLGFELRCWRNVPDPDGGVVYLAEALSTAAFYAERAARMHGGEPVVLAIDASRLGDGRFVEDRDFRTSAEWERLGDGAWPGISAADASLRYDGKVGWSGRVPPEAVAEHFERRAGAGWTEAPAHPPGHLSR